MVRANVVLLGPQRLQPTLKDAVAALGIRGQLAAVTAGWEEREAEDQELSDHLGGRVVNLDVYRRAEEVYQRDPELFEAMQARHARLRSMQELYRLRLAHALGAARELLNSAGDEQLLDPEREAAIEAVRTLDAQHLARVAEVHAEFEDRYHTGERDRVARHRAELAAVIEGTEALCVAGGHVAILLNRMRIFDLPGLAGDRPIFAWSAGAMALAERIVLFHDNPPQGPGDAEVLENGLGAFTDLVALPHAKRRLRLDDETRVSLFARRFGPAICAVMDEGARLDWNGERWRGIANARRLTPAGSLVEIAS